MNVFILCLFNKYSHIDVLWRKPESIRKGDVELQIRNEHYTRVDTDYVFIFNPCHPFIELDTTGNPHLIDFEIETFYTSSHWYGYSGFILLNNMGDTVAYENINTAANVFGIGPNTTEIRTLDVTQNLTLPFSGTIHLIEGWFAGNPTTQCSFPFTISTGTTGITVLSSPNKHLMLITDMLGRTTHPTPNTLLFYIYDDGSVEKRIQFER